MKNRCDRYNTKDTLKQKDTPIRVMNKEDCRKAFRGAGDNRGKNELIIKEKKPVKDTLRKRAKKSGKLFLTTRYSNYNKSVEGKGGKQFIDLTYAFFEPGRKTSDSSGGGPYDTRAEVAAAIHRKIKHYATRYNFIPGYKTIIINDETDMKLNVNEFLAYQNENTK